VETRVLTEADRGAAVAIWEAVGLTRPWNSPVDDFDRALAGATSTVLGTFDGEELVATVMVGHDGHRGWVYYLAVHPSMRGQGLGSRMMETAEDWLRERDVVKLNLMVRNSNSDALKFYERLGYEDGEVTVLGRWLV
jgi:ribosomal protein S18 acetylase RimI-like enzyme